MISQNQLLLIEVGAESELMFKGSDRQPGEITFFPPPLREGHLIIKERGEGEGEEENRGLQDPSFAHKSQRHGHFSAEQSRRCRRSFTPPPPPPPLSKKVERWRGRPRGGVFSTGLRRGPKAKQRRYCPFGETAIHAGPALLSGFFSSLAPACPAKAAPQHPPGGLGI